MEGMTSSALIQTMTSSYLNEMYDVTGVNVFPRKLMKFPRKEKVNSVPYPLLTGYVWFYLQSVVEIEQEYKLVVYG